MSNVQWSIVTNLPNVTIDQTGKVSAGKIGWSAGTARIELKIDDKAASKDINILPSIPAVGEVTFKQDKVSISAGQSVVVTPETTLSSVSGDLNSGTLTVSSPTGDKVSAAKADDGTWSVKLEETSSNAEESVEIDLNYVLADITHTQKLTFEVVLVNDSFSIGGSDSVTAGSSSQFNESEKTPT